MPITEQLYVGLYCSDCVCQTDEEEIVPLKKTTELLNTLCRVGALGIESNWAGDRSLLFNRKSNL